MAFRIAPILAVFGAFGSLIVQAPSQTVCLDPGHPSEIGNGTKGKSLTEIEAAWTVAKELEKKLVGQGFRVVLTKKAKDQKVTNPERAAIANRAKADLFLRLHCDAAAGTGFAVHHPDRQGRRGVHRGPSDDVIRQSAALAKSIHRVLARELEGVHADRGLKSDRATKIGSRQGALTGSIHAKVPVVLVELAVLTNPRDERFLANPATRKALVDALAEAVCQALKPKSAPKRREPS